MKTAKIVIRTLLFISLLWLVACSPNGAALPIATTNPNAIPPTAATTIPTEEPTEAMLPVVIVAETATPEITAAPTETAVPTQTPLPTDTPAPTDTPVPTEAAAVNGTVLGSVQTADGRVMAGGAVELCDGLMLGFYAGETPCSERPQAWTTVTAADGTFQFADVLPGVYQVAYTVDGEWVVLTDAAAQLLSITVEQAGTADLGALTRVTE